MNGTILILTNSEDGKHSDIVISKLNERHQTVFRMNSDHITTGELQLSLRSMNSDTNLEFACDGQTLNIADIKSVWYRRPNRFGLKISDQIQKAYAERELSILLESLWAIIPNTALWISKPRSLENSRKKAYQLKLAQNLGLNIPRTIVTNVPELVLKFYDECNKKIIFKTIYNEFLDYGEQAYNIPTTLITAKHLQQLNLIKTLPGLFQEYVPKNYEVRVTIVGNRIFSVKIDSQSNSLAHVDWRNPICINNLSYSPIQIPGNICDACLQMLESFDLQFGAFDFIVDPEGKWYFLEINPNGQWFWIEDKTGLLVR